MFLNATNLSYKCFERIAFDVILWRRESRVDHDCATWKGFSPESDDV